jgi:hypothetical protein
MLDTSNKVRWTWLAEPFGTSLAETDPSGLGAVTFNLRFPGQFYDAEPGINWICDPMMSPRQGRLLRKLLFLIVACVLGSY